MNSKKTHFDRLDYSYKLLVIIALVIAGVMMARDIVIPLLIAGILSIVLMPVVKKLEQKIPPTLAVTMVLLSTLILFVLAGMLIVNQLASLIRDLPDLETKFDSWIDQISRSLRINLGLSLKEQNQILKSNLTTLGSYATELFSATTNVISLLIQIPIYIFLFLIYRDRFNAFFISLLSDQQEVVWKKEVEGVVQGYISGLMLVTIIIAALNSVGLLILGIDHAVFFGILSGILTIIPYVGIFIGAALPLVMALLTKDSLWYPAGVIII
ncbi:MAG: hypothetical protein RI909_2071, partial [Bacteroidota bacterium]